MDLNLDSSWLCDPRQVTHLLWASFSPHGLDSHIINICEVLRTKFRMPQAPRELVPLLILPFTGTPFSFGKPVKNKALRNGKKNRRVASGWRAEGPEGSLLDLPSREPGSELEVGSGAGGPSLTAWQGHLARVLRTPGPPGHGPPGRCLGREKLLEWGHLGPVSCHHLCSPRLSYARVPRPGGPCQLASPEGQDKAERVAFSGAAGGTGESLRLGEPW